MLHWLQSNTRARRAYTEPVGIADTVDEGVVATGHLSGSSNDQGMHAALDGVVSQRHLLVVRVNAWLVACVEGSHNNARAGDIYEVPANLHLLSRILNQADLSLANPYLTVLAGQGEGNICASISSRMLSFVHPASPFAFAGERSTRHAFS